MCEGDVRKSLGGKTLYTSSNVFMEGLPPWEGGRGCDFHMFSAKSCLIIPDYHPKCFPKGWLRNGEAAWPGRFKDICFDLTLRDCQCHSSPPGPLKIRMFHFIRWLRTSKNRQLCSCGLQFAPRIGFEMSLALLWGVTRGQSTTWQTRGLSAKMLPNLDTAKHHGLGSSRTPFLDLSLRDLRRQSNRRIQNAQKNWSPRFPSWTVLLKLRVRKGIFCSFNRGSLKSSVLLQFFSSKLESAPFSLRTLSLSLTSEILTESYVPSEKHFPVGLHGLTRFETSKEFQTNFGRLNGNFEETSFEIGGKLRKFRLKFRLGNV